MKRGHDPFNRMRLNAVTVESIAGLCNGSDVGFNGSWHLMLHDPDADSHETRRETARTVCHILSGLDGSPVYWADISTRQDLKDCLGSLALTLLGENRHSDYRDGPVTATVTAVNRSLAAAFRERPTTVRLLLHIRHPTELFDLNRILRTVDKFPWLRVVLSTGLEQRLLPVQSPFRFLWLARPSETVHPDSLRAPGDSWTARLAARQHELAERGRQLVEMLNTECFSASGTGWMTGARAHSQDRQVLLAGKDGRPRSARMQRMLTEDEAEAVLHHLCSLRSSSLPALAACGEGAAFSPDDADTSSAIEQVTLGRASYRGRADWTIKVDIRPDALHLDPGTADSLDADSGLTCIGWALMRHRRDWLEALWEAATGGKWHQSNNAGAVRMSEAKAMFDLLDIPAVYSQEPAEVDAHCDNGGLAVVCLETPSGESHAVLRIGDGLYATPESGPFGTTGIGKDDQATMRSALLVPPDGGRRREESPNTHMTSLAGTAATALPSVEEASAGRVGRTSTGRSEA